MSLKILIADDDPVSRDVLREMLTRLGHEVIGEVEDGADAVGLYRFRARKPDLVLMDIDMPFLDGLHAIAQIRKIHETARIIVVTGTNTPIDDIMSVGALGVLRKPCHPDTVKAVLEKFEAMYRATLKTHFDTAVGKRGKNPGPGAR